jgi:hypothetical protein
MLIEDDPLGEFGNRSDTGYSVNFSVQLRHSRERQQGRRVFKIMRHFLYSRGLGIHRGSTDLLTLLDLHYDALCSDLRDRVYTLLGVAIPY